MSHIRHTSVYTTRRAEPKGRTIGEFLREEISGPLGADAFIGVKEDDLDKFSDLQAWGMGKVLMQSFVPSSMGRKIDPSFMDFLRVFRLMKDATKTKKGTQKVTSQLTDINRIGNNENSRQGGCRGAAPAAGRTRKHEVAERAGKVRDELQHEVRELQRSHNFCQLQCIARIFRVARMGESPSANGSCSAR